FFHFHAIRYAFYSIHPTYGAECESKRLTLIAYARDARYHCNFKIKVPAIKHPPPSSLDKVGR
ncbi:hypothetical protein OHD17_00575, partial [Escherichia coli]|uniref:hypothetical protein n=1 Tax=Escherichia coli TaxID=562 RepID=UPI002238DB27|nr:hypothetical protein [Escherichia coli]